jgi:hypothetical protein
LLTDYPFLRVVVVVVVVGGGGSKVPLLDPGSAIQ